VWLGLEKKKGVHVMPSAVKVELQLPGFAPARAPEGLVLSSESRGEKSSSWACPSVVKMVPFLPAIGA